MHRKISYAIFFFSFLVGTLAFDAHAQIPPPPLPPSMGISLSEDLSIARIIFLNNLAFGMTGDEVFQLQYTLQTKGYLPPEHVPTDYFGVKTRSAVMAYQRAQSILATGFVGPLTRAALNVKVLGKEDSITMNLGLGNSGQQVYLLQDKLSILGYFSEKATGYFGVKTRVAVMAYQQARGIPTTGFVGPLTRAALARPVVPPGQPLGQAALRYAILDKYQDFFFCDPDYYPVGRGDEQEKAIAEFDAIKNNQEEFYNILNHLHYEGIGPIDFAVEQKLAIYREHKKLRAIYLEPTEPYAAYLGAPSFYKFVISIIEGDFAGFRIEGKISDSGGGTITETKREKAISSCPRCLSENTLIDTPNGQTAVKDIQEGMLVWTSDKNGNQAAVPVLKISKTPVPRTHEMIYFMLSDGRELMVSPGHPTADGRSIGNLTAGDIIDGSRVVSVKRTPYKAGFTYDILPAGETGTYWANSILLGSTLQ